MNENEDQIAVVVVNYGTADLAIKAVESVLSRSHGNRQVTVHLVDNASPNGDAQTLHRACIERSWGDRVMFWPEAENHGFGRGNNVVLQKLAAKPTPPDKVFLLNPDAQLHNEAIDLLAQALDADLSLAAVGAAVLRPDLTPATAAFRFPGLRSELARTLALGAFDRLVSKHLTALPPEQPDGLVDWVSGAAVMFRFKAIADIGFFDSGFFLYYEEVDLMRRLQAKGGRVRYVPSAQVLHMEGAATGQFASAETRQRNPSYLYQSWAHYFSNAYGRGTALGIACALWPAAVVNILHRRLRGKAPTIPQSFFADHWRHVVWPLIRRKPQRA